MLKLFYYKHNALNGFGNFGDELSPIIIKRCFNLEVEFAPLWKADMVSIGSILDLYAIRRPRAIAKNFLRFTPLSVWGTGLMFDKPCKFPWFMEFHAVRGNNTVSVIGKQAAHAALGDPGLLSHLLLEKPINKKYGFGIIPHYKDLYNTHIQRLLETLPSSTIINVCDDPISVVKKISSCEAIISTSLHGLIVSDSLGIPNIWAEASNEVEGNGYKFRDYYSVFCITQPKYINLRTKYSLKDINVLLAEYSRPDLKRIKDSLLKSFPL